MFTQLWTVKFSDWQRALIVAILTGPIDIIYQWATTTQPINWQDVVKTAVAGGLAYLIKNFITGMNGKILTNK
jgi:hypothetical protein